MEQQNLPTENSQYQKCGAEVNTPEELWSSMVISQSISNSDTFMMLAETVNRLREKAMRLNNLAFRTRTLNSDEEDLDWDLWLFPFIEYVGIDFPHERERAFILFANAKGNFKPFHDLIAEMFDRFSATEALGEFQEQIIRGQNEIQ